jgi:DNA-directed RNA polymerase alpha subunit
MVSPNVKGTVISFDEIIKLVKKSNFYNLEESFVINNSLLREINLKNIDLPFRLKCFTNKNGIMALEELLNTKLHKILKCRNIGIKTINETQKIIIDYLYRIEDCLKKIEPSEYKAVTYDSDNIIVKYFPLLKGTFKTTRLNYNFIYKDLSCVNVPKRIEEYIRKRKEIKIINDLLNINYDELKKEQNIGRKTIWKLQITLIDFLCLEKVIFLTQGKIKYKK